MALQVTGVAPPGWPVGMRVIARKERPHPGAQLRIRNAKDTGLTNQPLHAKGQNRTCCAIVTFACEITAWLQMLTLHGHDGRRLEPKCLRLRTFSAAGHVQDLPATPIHSPAGAPHARIRG